MWFIIKIVQIMAFAIFLQVLLGTITDISDLILHINTCFSQKVILKIT